MKTIALLIAFCAGPAFAGSSASPTGVTIRTCGTESVQVAFQISRMGMFIAKIVSGEGAMSATCTARIHDFGKVSGLQSLDCVGQWDNGVDAKATLSGADGILNVFTVTLPDGSVADGPC